MVIGRRDEILSEIGAAVKRERLGQNITQAVLSERSGVSLNALKHLESGGRATLGTFVLVCRSLGRDAWIKSFCGPNDEISPVEYVELLERGKQKERKRARRQAAK